MKYIQNDGGRRDAGFKGRSGDCAIRAMAIACDIPYKDARAKCKDAAEVGRMGSRAIARGMYKEDMTAALAVLGWSWHSAPKFEGRKARCFDMPAGKVIARQAHHFVAVVDGVPHDTFDCTGKMVYGYWAKENGR